jgi:3'-5' exonuclease
MLRNRIVSCGATRLTRQWKSPHRHGFVGCGANLARASQSSRPDVLPPLERRHRRRTHLFSSLSVMNATSYELPPLDVAANAANDRAVSSMSTPVTAETENGAHFDAAPKLDDLGVKSRPLPNGRGMWKPDDPGWWYKGFGSRSEERQRRLESLIRLRPGDEGYFDVSDIRVPMVTVVRTAEDARAVMERLMGPESEARFHACDTEVMDLDLKSVGPVGNGYVTCASVYSGEDFDYGLGDGPGTVLWIDNLDDACGVLQEFKAWFEDERFKKIWHNYGFDRHVMWNEGIDCRGFGGDTMHMARLEDSSRSREGNGNGYSLEALTEELVGRRKRPMKEIFGIKRLRKDGSEGSIIDLPPIEVMQRDPGYRSKWIEYGCYDAQGTFLIHKELRKRLCRIPWLSDGDGGMTNNLYEYYWQHMRPFGEVLTDMERRG